MGHMGKDEVVSLHLFFPVRFSELIPQGKKSVKNLGANLILSFNFAVCFWQVQNRLQ